MFGSAFYYIAISGKLEYIKFMSSPRRTRLDFLKSLPPRTLAQAKRKIIDLMARRDHSAKEIRDKLKRRTEPDVLEQAMAWAYEQNWIPSEEKLQEQVVRALGYQKKGQNAINLKLKKLGLKPVRLDPETEYENAVRALESKFKSDILKGLDFKSFQKEKARVMRFLLGKGFNTSTIQKAVKSYFETRS